MRAANRYSQTFFVLSFALVLYAFYRILEPFLVAVVLALTVVSLFYANYEELRRRLGNRSNLSSVIMCTIITFLIIIPLLLLFLLLASEVSEAYATFQKQQPYLAQQLSGDGDEVLRRFWERLGRYMGQEGMDLAGLISTLVDRGAQYLLEHYSSILGRVGSLIGNFFVMIFSMFFFFRDGDSFVREVKKLIPLAPEYEDMVFDKLKAVTQATFLGIFATGISQGVMAGIIFFALGFKNPILWGTVTAFFSLLPILGTAAVWAPMSIYLMSTGEVGKGVILFTLGVTVIGLVDNLVRPLIIEGRSEGIHLLLVFFALAGGLLYFGPAGLVLGPLVVSLLVTFLEIYKIEFEEELG